MGNKTGKGGFKKGKSGNEGGRPKKDPLVQALKDTTYKDFIQGLQKYGTLSRTEMAVELQRPDATMFEIMFGQIVASAAKGDRDARQVLLERLWGKVKEVHDVNNTDHKRDLDGIPKERIIEFLREKD